MKRILMLAFAAALSMSVSACQDTTSPGAVLAGTYTLRTINNQSPPIVYSADATGTLELIGGQIRIDRDGTFTYVSTWRDTPSGSVPGPAYDVSLSGSWTLSGNILSLYDASDPSYPYEYTVSNNQLIYADYASGVTFAWVYSK